MPATVRIGLIQMSMAAGIRQNMAKAVRMIEDAARQGAQVVCLPELYRSRYFPRKRSASISRLTETVPGESTEMFAKLAAKLEVVLIVPVYESDGGRLYNTACVIDADGSLLGSYRKIHIPDDPSFYEAEYFESGNHGYSVYESRYLRFAPLICYDQWIPEAARIVALKGAEVIFYPSAIGHLAGDPLSPDDWRSGWETIQRSHAIANGVHVAALNRVGEEGEVAFWGGSFVCDGFGRMLAQAPIGDEHVLVTEVDIRQNREIQEGWGFRVNRHPETYERIVEPVRDPTPIDVGLSMPAEWDAHFATWLAWPYDTETFDDIPAVEEAYARLINALHVSERIELLVRDSGMRSRVSGFLRDRGIALDRIAFHPVDYADVWIRDYGPMFVVNRSRTRSAVVQWDFNAWGEKYDTLLKDARIPDLMAPYLQVPYFRPGAVLEGGSIDGNGVGTILTTEQCLLNPNRNHGLSQGDIGGLVAAYTGAKNIVWLKGGIAGDDTDGHVDTVARFVGPNTILCAYEDDPNDDNHAVLAENYRRLYAATDQYGNSFEIIKIPMPRPVARNVGDDCARLPATYLNFYAGNESVLMPAFNDPMDDRVRAILQDAFPGRAVVAIDSVDLIRGFGGFHCITQQEPQAGQTR